MDYSRHAFGIPRFARNLVAEDAQVDLWCHRPLVSLLPRVPGFGNVTDFIPPKVALDFHAPMADMVARYLPSRDSPHWAGLVTAQRSSVSLQHPSAALQGTEAPLVECLFRQPARGDWPSVVESVRAEIAALSRSG